MKQHAAGHASGRRVRAEARQALKWFAATADRFRPRTSGVVVLIYHRVGGNSGLELDLPVARFTEQMAWLADRGLLTSLDAGLDDLARGQAAARDRVVVTFDDGTRDFVDHAMPVLAQYRVPVVLYLATGFVDGNKPLPYGAPPVSWSGLKDALAGGLVTVGSHTHTHALLDRLAPSEIARELDTSRRLIEDHLGVSPEHFAYPKALPGSPPAEAAVRERFRSAALAGTRLNRFGDTDPYRLARSPVQASDGMRWFRAKARGGMELEDSVRRALNRVRHRTAVT
ncbi:MAG: polysaccharide deacetylase family protein [Acidimicrobiia bacterium]|nr:polysaccharide deacetylase family protein [Acidimicrobiia bacterium]